MGWPSFQHSKHQGAIFLKGVLTWDAKRVSGKRKIHRKVFLLLIIKCSLFSSAAVQAGALGCLSGSLGNVFGNVYSNNPREWTEVCFQGNVQVRQGKAASFIHWVDSTFVLQYFHYDMHNISTIRKCKFMHWQYSIRTVEFVCSLLFSLVFSIL